MQDVNNGFWKFNFWHHYEFGYSDHNIARGRRVRSGLVTKTGPVFIYDSEWRIFCHCKTPLTLHQHISDLAELLYPSYPLTHITFKCTINMHAYATKHYISLKCEVGNEQFSPNKIFLPTLPWLLVNFLIFPRQLSNFPDISRFTGQLCYLNRLLQNSMVTGTLTDDG